MKKVFIILCICASYFCEAQTTTSYQLTSYNQVGLTSPKQDTLYLINDQLGLCIHKSWYMKDQSGRDLYFDKPYFVFLSEDKFHKKLNERILAEKTKIQTTHK